MGLFEKNNTKEDFTSKDDLSIDTIPKEIFDKLIPLAKAYLIWKKENSKRENI